MILVGKQFALFFSLSRSFPQFLASLADVFMMLVRLRLGLVSRDIGLPVGHPLFQPRLDCRVLGQRHVDFHLLCRRFQHRLPDRFGLIERPHVRCLHVTRNGLRLGAGSHRVSNGQKQTDHSDENGDPLGRTAQFCLDTFSDFHSLSSQSAAPGHKRESCRQ